MLESAPRRAFEDTRKWLRDSLIAWIVITVVLGLVAAIFVPTIQDPTIIDRILYGALGTIVAIIVILLVAYIIHLQVAPYRQRNEALQREDNLQHHIRTLQDEYVWALSFDGVGRFPYAGRSFVSLKFSNTIDKPIGYEFDMSNTYVELDDKRIPLPRKCPNTGGIISKSKPLSFTIPYPLVQLLQANKVLLRYELKYGRPDQYLRWQMRELDLDLAYSATTNQISIATTELKREEQPIVK